MDKFKLVSDYNLAGDQEKAVNELVSNIEKHNVDFQTLLGVTGSGKTFTMANVIERLNRPTLIISHNKTLAAQLYSEFKNFFPENAVEYFVSYYDYYQPEAYIIHSDTYIEKDSSINEEIDKLRLSATRSLLTRRDVIIIASVSCIFGLGSPTEWKNQYIILKKNEIYTRNDLLRDLVNILYNRNDIEFRQATFRVKGDVVDIFPAYDDTAIRVEFFDDYIEAISIIDPLLNKKIETIDETVVFPAKHYVIPEDKFRRALSNIQEELRHRITYFKKNNQLIEAQRIEQRTLYDIEMLEEIGYCNGIENYSRHLDGRSPGQAPYTLIDFFPDDYLMFIDESHVTVPQLHGMYNGDRSRKKNLIDYGFRLESAYDNRPLKFEEFESKQNKCIYVSATPADYELNKSDGIIIEQIIRPTGLVDPEIIVRSDENQVDDLLKEIDQVTKNGFRILVTTLTKKNAESLTDYYKNVGIKVRYLHSEIDTLERIEIIRDLRLGKFDVLIGVNLLREGLDLPEVSLVAILDADKEGFLRSARALIQTIGRAARNVKGRVILYGGNMTNSMKNAIEETQRRRDMQIMYNEKNNIIPKSINSRIHKLLIANEKVSKSKKDKDKPDLSAEELQTMINELKDEMIDAANNLRFEDAAIYRDKINELEEIMLFYS